MLEARDVSRKYTDKSGKENVILDHLNFKAEDGEFVCLIGMSGCGKSTLLRLLSGLDIPSEGEIFLDGEQVRKPVDKGAFVFQDYALFPWYTVLKNVEFGAKINKIYPKNILREKALEFLELTHLENYKDAYIHQLSGGMKQRVAIARALIMNPEILFMDEPFGALDSFTRMELQDLLREIVTERKISVVFVTHDIEEAVYLGDRVAVMNRHSGKIDSEIKIHFEGSRERNSQEFNIFKEKIYEEFNLTRKFDIEYHI